jgi:hypothetical protein
LSAKDHISSFVFEQNEILEVAKHSARTLRETDVEVVKFEVFTAVIMKNAVFRDVTPCGSCKNRHFGGT